MDVVTRKLYKRINMKTVKMTLPKLMAIKINVITIVQMTPNITKVWKSSTSDFSFAASADIVDEDSGKQLLG